MAVTDLIQKVRELTVWPRDSFPKSQEMESLCPHTHTCVRMFTAALLTAANQTAVSRQAQSGHREAGSVRPGVLLGLEGRPVPGPPTWVGFGNRASRRNQAHRPRVEWFIRTAGGRREEGSLLEKEPWEGKCSGASQGKGRSRRTPVGA